MATAIAPSRTPLSPPASSGQQQGSWIVYDNVPIFDEHQSEDGVTYDRQLLQIIAENCNRRIRDTGDWCPLVIGHTSDEGDAADPPLVGFAGPFTVGQIGKERPRWAILAKFWLFPENAKVMARHPRRSVEVWPGDQPQERYFDPIALLGAETPRRDLGLIYSKPRRVSLRSTREMPDRIYTAAGKLFYSRSASMDRKPERYEAGFASGTSTFIPVRGGNTPKPARYQESTTMPLAEGDLQQIIEALKPTVQSIVDQQLGGAMGDDITGDDFGDDAGVDDPGIPPAVPDATPPGVGAPPPALGAPPAPAPSPDAGGPPSQDDDDAAQKYLAMKFRKYAAGEDGGKKWWEGLDDDDKGAVRKYMQSCDSEEDKQRYSKLDAEFKPEPAAGDPSVQKYRKQRDEWKIRYSRLNEQHGELKQKYAKMEGEVHRYRKEAWDSKRKTELTELSTRGIVFDMEDEIEETETMTPEQFENHKKKMATHYQRAPMHHIPVDRTTAPIAVKPGDHGKYSERARDVVLKYRKEGKSLSYAKVIDKLVATKGNATESDLVTLTE